MNYAAGLKEQIANKKGILLTVAIIIVGGCLLKIIADTQSRVEY